MAMAKRRSISLTAVLAAAIASGCSLLLDDGYTEQTPPPHAPLTDDAGKTDDVWVAPTEPADAADAEAVGKRRPDEGIYAYVATGKDSINVLGNTRTAPYGPTASVAIVHEDADCYSAKLTLRTGYTEKMDLCLRGSETIRVGVHRSQHLAVLGGILVSTVMTCKPGDTMTLLSPAPEQEWPHICTGRNEESETGTSQFTSGGPYEYVGEEDVVVGGAAIRTRHLREELVVTGSQQGTNNVDWYFAVEDGLLVRLVRKTSIAFPTAFFSAYYTEDADLTLVSTTPAPLAGDAGADAAPGN